MLKFKCLAKIMLYAKVDCCHLNPNVKRLMHTARCKCFLHFNLAFSIIQFLDFVHRRIIKYIKIKPLQN
jgi:hypothetical protein